MELKNIRQKLRDAIISEKEATLKKMAKGSVQSIFDKDHPFGDSDLWFLTQVDTSKIRCLADALDNDRKELDIVYRSILNSFKEEIPNENS